MKLNLKNVLFSVGIFVFALSMFGLSAHRAEAAACTALTGTHNWSDPAAWTAAGDCDGATNIPGAATDVTLPSGALMTADGTVGSPSLAGTVTINNVGATTSLTIGTGHKLLVAGLVSITAPTTNPTSSTLAVVLVH